MKFLACLPLAAAALSAQTFSGAAAVDQAIADAIAENRLPGAVLAIGHNGQIVYLKAYGQRAIYPQAEPMTVDTIFDCASLTKVLATTSSLMQLFEQGKFHLDDKVTAYFPDFQGGKSDITLRNLFTHFSGLRPDLPLAPAWTGYDTGIRMAMADKPASPPGERFVYSDINFIVLGDLVRRLSGQPLDEYARQHVFLPLGMKETQFLPPPALIPRIAPTEREPKDGPALRGVVHDPTARYMGGVAGHAGVFSTASDLARFAQMMIDGGSLDGVRIASPHTVAEFTRPQGPAGQPILRGLGWDIDSSYSRNRGDLFPIGSFGHTGFTGTSLWIDPCSRTYVILLANSVHPGARPPISALRSKVATIVAASVGIAAQRSTLNGCTARALTGLDVLVEQKFQPLAGKHVGLITNQTGGDGAGRRNVDLMRQAGIDVVALFSPEHGLAGVEDRPGIADATDPATGIKVFSLYGKTTRPTPEMLHGIDALVFDIQSAGVRFYTYETTMAYALEAAAKAGIPFFVLDRPNPITGMHVEGPLLDPAKTSFVGYLEGEPVRHGMTIGELAGLFNATNRIGASLTVIPMRGWSRSDWFDSTGLPWVNPSPNLRSLKAATLYPGLCLLEWVPGLSVGRGTATPFEQIGAPYVAGRELAAYLDQRQIPGVRVSATAFTPTESVAKGVRIEGIRFEVTDREALDTTRVGLEVLSALRKLYPGKIDLAAGKKLIGSDDVLSRLTAGEDPRAIVQGLRDSVAEFARQREPYLLYK